LAYQPSQQDFARASSLAKPLAGLRGATTLAPGGRPSSMHVDDFQRIQSKDKDPNTSQLIPTGLITSQESAKHSDGTSPTVINNSSVEFIGGKRNC
jgi:hypothetical protein